MTLSFMRRRQSLGAERLQHLRMPLDTSLHLAPRQGRTGIERDHRPSCTPRELAVSFTETVVFAAPASRHPLDPTPTDVL